MSFTADQADIRRFGQAVGDLTDDADIAVNYARDHLSIGYSEGRMFFTVVQKANEVRDALTANYRDTDQAAAARLDATY